MNDGVGNLSSTEVIKGLCLSCGLCCNGVIFADVKFQDPAQAERLAALGVQTLPVGSSRKCAESPWKSSPSKTFRLPQPCSAWDGARCRVYRQRPAHCRDFECLLFKSVKQGDVTQNFALGRIAATRKSSERADQLLQRLESPNRSDRMLPLAQRFRRVLRRVAASPVTAEQALQVSELTTAMHRLNLLLSRWFYPG